MKRILLLLLIIAAGAYYANQAGLVPGWRAVPLPEWVPAWARVDHEVAAAGAEGQGRTPRLEAGSLAARVGSAKAADEGPVPVVVVRPRATRTSR